MTIPGADRHALYRFFDSSGALLYIGLTANPGRRFSQHAGDKPWWVDVAEIRLETHPDRSSVTEAERAAIQNERPRYNIVHATTAPQTLEQAQPKSLGEWPVEVGDVVALGLDRDECHVGKVEAVTEFGVKLSLLSWLTGFFDAEVTLRWERVLEVRYGYRIPAAAAKRDGWADQAVVYDCDPLADFQVFWTAGRGQPGRQAVQDWHRERAAS